jgi:glycosyltransferase involved in cell wall biosynthesis
LTKALHGLSRQTLPSNLFETIVIDNGSSDDTHATVQQWQGGKMAMHYVFEPVIGLSHARNRGWREAKGRFVAYIDDDAIPEPDWLQNAADELASADPGLGLLGGRVLPIWESPKPAWLSDRLTAFLSMVDLGEGRRRIDSYTGIVGANMIVLREGLASIGGFSEKLGRKDANLLSNEELMVKKALAETGFHAMYRGDVAVRHHAPADRLTRSWFLRRLYWQGRSDIAWRNLTDPLDRVQCLKLSAKGILRAAWHGIRGIVMTSDAATRFNSFADSAYHFGVAAEALVLFKADKDG